MSFSAPAETLRRRYELPQMPSVVHKKVHSPETLEGRRDQLTAAFRSGNIAVVRDRFASTGPNEVGHLLRYRGVRPEPDTSVPGSFTTTRARPSAMMSRRMLAVAIAA
jgi:hypothetical protein